ncbi:protein of unknown function [Pseudodesulfovibrio profundus]|uniref:Uncharacterized protein n=1 Tax=Pseudodesulfovibrio profundus TaxID=57320 RepID=A0A2C8F680_9BACT|nr:hypothetical protein [Pseudodesulfovibrio profundus]SOB58235.1 protein of unknown function [Pseudodesulfovibrio profundus]
MFIDLARSRCSAPPSALRAAPTGTGYAPQRLWRPASSEAQTRTPGSTLKRPISGPKDGGRRTYYQADLYNDESANPDEYQLQTGDIFVKENKNVYVICNAECDLAFNSQTGRKRKDDLPILFVPGDLKLYQGVPQSPLGFINIDNEDYSVFLNENLTFSMPYSEVSDWANKCNCQRKFRLKTKHALNLQKSVSEQIFRIGSHKTPPIYRTVSLELYHREKIGSHLFVKSRLPKPISGSSVTSGKKMDRYDLNIAFPNILDISAAMANHANELVQTAIEIYKTEDKPKWYKQRMDLYESVSDNFKNLHKYFFNTSFKASGDKIDELVTTVCYNEFEPKSINGNHMFVLLIKNND